MEARVIDESKLEWKRYGVISVAKIVDDPEAPFSQALIRIKGKNHLVLNTVSTACYEIIEGSGRFTLENETVEVRAGMTVFIPRGVAFRDEGEMVMRSTYTPKFNRADEILLED